MWGTSSNPDPATRTMIVAPVCPISFAGVLSALLSSITPAKTRHVAASMIGVMGKTSETNSVEVVAKATKMATPPKYGIGSTWVSIDIGRG